MTNFQYLSCSISDVSCFVNPQVSIPSSKHTCAIVPGDPILTINFWCNKQEDSEASAVYKCKITGYEKSPMDFWEKKKNSAP